MVLITRDAQIEFICSQSRRAVVLAEDYLAQGTAPSLVTFAVTVSPGKAWVMGDNRGLAIDSREWGPLAIGDVSGRVIEALGSRGSTLVRVPATFTADGLARDGHRLPFPLVMAGLALIHPGGDGAGNGRRCHLGSAPPTQPPPAARADDLVSWNRRNHAATARLPSTAKPRLDSRPQGTDTPQPRT